jgi:hypothetical protein
MKKCKRGILASSKPVTVVARSLLVAGGVVLLTKAWAQSVPQPGLAVTAKTTNSMVITITNGVNYAIYDLWTTPVLGNADFPWTVQALGGAGQTNFSVPLGPLATGFYQVLVDNNNGVPLWAAANPTNPVAGFLAVFIDSPTNGAVVPQN